jgi:hypothetical protein
MPVRTFSLAALLCLAACTGSEGPSPDGGPGGAGGGSGDDTPITQRPSRGTYQCTQQRGRTDHTPRSWQINPPALVTTSKGAFLARIESMGSMPFNQPPPELLLSSFDVAGTFGPPTTLPLANRDEAGGLAAAPRGDGFALVWIDGSKLRFAAFDPSGQNVVPAKDVLDGIDRLATPMLAAGPDGGFGLVWAPTNDTRMGQREVRFAVLDGMGTIRKAPRSLTPKPGSTFTHPAPAITASASGYAMAWRDPGSELGGIDFETADAGGAPLIARHRVSAANPGAVAGGLSGFEPPTTALLATGGGYLVAWAEEKIGLGDSGASSVVRLARLDSAGVRQGTPAVLRAATKDIDEVEPTLVPFGDAVAVFWGRGGHIYICGGCVPDNSIELVLVDPATLTPVSNVLSLGNGGDPRGGGLLRRRVAVLGESLLTTYLLHFHVHATPGSAAFKCTKP